MGWSAGSSAICPVIFSVSWGGLRAVLAVEVNGDDDDGEEHEHEDDGGGVEPVEQLIEAAGEGGVGGAAGVPSGVRHGSGGQPQDSEKTCAS
jgi:hypothetical protein